MAQNGARTWSWWENLLSATGMEGSDSHIVANKCALDSLSGENGWSLLGERRWEGGGLGGEGALGGGKAGLPQNRWAHNRSHFELTNNNSFKDVKERVRRRRC